MQICTNLGALLALEKIEITLDTAHVEIRLPQCKLLRMKESLSKWLGMRTVTEV